jgi:S-adenosyl-L-methionine hydrolase (adenosine-forming)
MTIVTLTTDFGLQDYYVPALKGSMLSRFSALNIVDISHNITNHDIVQAAFVFKNAWKAFPAGTIHALSVNNLGGEKYRFLIVAHEGHYFIGPDNGIFSLIFNQTPQLAYEVPFSGLNFIPLRDCLANAVGHIAQELPLEDIGTPVDDLVERISLQPVISPSQIRGAVIHVDNFDNVIINITRDLFEKVGRGRDFQLYFKRHDPITRLAAHYNDVPIGEPLCLFNSDYLEIAINMGKAAEMLGLKIEDTIQIDFQTEV